MTRRWDEPAPGEAEAGEHTWKVVRTAFDERVPAPDRRRWRPLVAVGVGAAIVAAALSPPGQAVFGSLRDAVRGEENAKPALFSLPTTGRLLVESHRGIWVVQRDGSKRLLSGYHDATWSPHGLYVAGVSGGELRALEPNGNLHWSIGRPGRIQSPRWSFDGFRIAYFARGALRIVNGDGTDDHLLTRDARPSVAAWEPGSHVLAYVSRTGNIAVTNVDGARPTVYVRTRLSPQQLAWTPDRRLVAVGARAIGIFARRGPQLRRIGTAARIVTAALSPDGTKVAFIEANGAESTLSVTRTTAGPAREIFKGRGMFTSVVWSGDGRWLLLDWTSADQWLFIRFPVRRIVAVSNIRASFGEAPSLAGWCCP